VETWREWCSINGVCPAPAAPADIARFVNDVAGLGIECVWAIVQEISQAHQRFNLSDPTRTDVVAHAVNVISKLVAPRSWPKEDHELFMLLPYDVQLVVARRESARDRELRRLQNENAQLRKEQDAKSTPQSDDAGRAATEVTSGAH
jgi:hypothetical protein